MNVFCNKVILITLNGQISLFNFAHCEMTQWLWSGVYAKLRRTQTNRTSDFGTEIFFRQKSSVKLLTFQILCFDVLKTFFFSKTSLKIED